MPKYNANGDVDVTLIHPIFGEVKFCASPNDSEQHGRDLYARSVAGEFGSIAAYVATPIMPPIASTSLQFMDRFTESEQLAIVTATMTIPQVKLWYDRMLCAEEIVYKDARTLAGLQALVAAGLITQARMDVVLPPEWR